MTNDLKANDYQKLAMRTCSITEDPGLMMLHGVFGLASEAGEVSAIFQKQFQGRPVNPEHLVRECGDVLWMVAEILTAVDVSMSECMEKNIKKLRARYPDGFDPERSLCRRPGDV